MASTGSVARDENRVPLIAGLSSSDGTTVVPVYVDPTTNALKVDATFSGGITEYTEDVAAPAAVTGGSTLVVRDDALSTVTPAEGDWIRLRGTAEGALWTQDFNSDAILADTNTIAGAVSGTEMQVDVITLPGVAGDVAHDAADSGNPVKIGGVAYNVDGTAPGTAVTEGDRAEIITDVYGRQLVSNVHPNLFSSSENNAIAQTNNEIQAAPGAGLSLYITDVIISNGATAGSVKIVENTASPTDILEEMYFAANGGAVIHLNTPIKVTANTNVGYTSTTVTTHSVTVNGYIAP